MEKSVEGGSAEDVQGRDYWGIVEPGCKRNRGLALGRPQGCDRELHHQCTGGSRPFSSTPTDRGTTKDFHHAAKRQQPVLTTAARGQRERRPALRAAEGRRHAVAAWPTAARRTRYLGLQAATQSYRGGAGRD